MAYSPILNPHPVSQSGGWTVTLSGTSPVSLASTTITGSVAVTGPLTDTQLRATAVPVSLASTTITGTVTTTGPLTDTQLRASAVPVSLASTTITGNVAVTGPLTDTQLRASVVPVSLASTTVTGTVAISAVSLPLPTGAALDATLTGGTQKSRITNGTVDAGVEPFGALNVNNGYQTLFYDEWATSPIDTVDRWTVTGTTPAVANGIMTMVATASTYNAIQTKDAVRPNVGFTLVRNGISLETAVSTGCGRFWGLGTPATVPAPAVLAQNGIGWEIDQATGALLAVTYAAGVRTTIFTGTRPTDGAIHAYGTYFRVTQAYWLMDGVVVASKSFPDIQVAGLPALIVRQNAAAFTGTPVFTNIAHLTADTSRQGVLVSDPVVGTRQARVNADGSLRVSGVAGGTALPVSAASLPLPAGAATETTLAALNTKVTAVNTGAVTISAALPTGPNTIGAVNIAAAQTLATVTTVGTVTTITNAVTVTPPTLTKGTQGATGFSVQNLNDAGRNPIHFYTVIPVLTSATDTLQSLTGTKSGATVTATATPAVVTTGKTLRITRLAATYIATATSGYGVVRLRFNTAGVVAVTSPVAATLAVGAGTPATANAAGMEEASLSEGWEFAAATGIGVSVQGFAAATATAVGYVLVSVTGYEY